MTTGDQTPGLHYCREQLLTFGFRDLNLILLACFQSENLRLTPDNVRRLSFLAGWSLRPRYLQADTYGRSATHHVWLV